MNHKKNFTPKMDTEFISCCISSIIYMQLVKLAPTIEKKKNDGREPMKKQSDSDNQL